MALVSLFQPERWLPPPLPTPPPPGLGQASAPPWLCSSLVLLSPSAQPPSHNLPWPLMSLGPISSLCIHLLMGFNCF